MTRGRAPNLALPLTKALAQQRDYRARKAANIARLEQENDTLRKENEQLAKELAVLRDVHHMGNPDTHTATPSSSSDEPVARTQTDYQHLRLSYLALEAEVRHKEHVLQILREKEREAFARLDGLLRQSLEVVDGARATKEEWTGSFPDGAIKGEQLQTVSDSHFSPHPNVTRADSVVSSARSFSPRGIAPPYHTQSRMPVEYNHSRMVSPSITRVHDEVASSPDDASYHSRKRIRSSSGSKSGSTAVPELIQSGPDSLPEPNRSRYISRQSAEHSTIGHFHAPFHGFPPHLPLHPRSHAIRELPPPRLSPYAIGTASFSTHSQVSSSPASTDLKGDYSHNISFLSTPPATSYFRVSLMFTSVQRYD